MTLRLPDDWLWDSWFAVDGDVVHAFFLYAPRSLGNPDLRHWNARIGHAVSRDLRTWDVLPPAILPGGPGAFDDLATWTGSVIAHAGRWLMFYTGCRRKDGGRIQRIGLATSSDLVTWTKTDLAIEADPRWYEKLAATGEEHWRDPWAFLDADGTVHLLVTARANQGPLDGRGVIGHVRSGDLVAWEVCPPVSEAGEFRQLEVPQLVEIDGAWLVLFSAMQRDHSAARLARPGTVAQSGTHYLVGDGPLGPFSVAPGPFLVGGADTHLYAGRIVEWNGERYLLAWTDTEHGEFIGELSDPMLVRVRPNGGLTVDVPPGGRDQSVRRP